MEDFIGVENVARYKRILAETNDPQKRETVRRLLAEEEARLKNGAGGPDSRSS
jgi:hypothetical protein